jgi:hypothetical protein
MNWSNFAGAAPELAEAAERLFNKSGLILIGTIRKDGSPRISPVEYMITDGELYFGSMWQALKALDLIRDPRCTVHSTVSDRFATDGEFKLHGRVRDVQGKAERKRVGDASRREKGWSPEGTKIKYHLFAVEVESAGFFTADGDKRLIKKWRAGEEVQAFHHYIDGRLVPVKK